MTMQITTNTGVTLDATDAPQHDGGELDAALARAITGDEAGFAVLWETLHPPLLRYLTARREQAPEDLAAETWLHVVRGLATFAGDAAAFRSWLFAIARHRAVDQARSRSRRPSVVVAVAAEPEDRDPTDRAVTPSAEDVALDQQATAWALALLATLPPAQAEMVALRVIAGLDVADVARLVGKRPGTVRVTVHRALRVLAEHPDVSDPTKYGVR